MDREKGAEDGCGEEVRWVGVAPGLAEGVAMARAVSQCTTRVGEMIESIGRRSKPSKRITATEQ